jgi:hypothetical protein
VQLSLLQARERFELIRLLSGEEWWTRFNALPESERPEDCRAVRCPTCLVEAWRNCRRPSGHAGKNFVGAHPRRWDLALAEAEARNPEHERSVR